MKWLPWGRDAEARVEPPIPDGDDSAWPSTHVAERDPRRIECLLDELLRSRRQVRLHVASGNDALEATLLRHSRGVMSLRTGTELATLPARVNVTAGTPGELWMFSVQTLPGSEGDRLQVSAPAELLHLQSREFFRVRCVHGRHHAVTLELHGSSAGAEALQLLDLSEGGAGVLLEGMPNAEEAAAMHATLRLEGERLPVARLRIAHFSPRREAQWRLGLQFTQMAPEAARALRRGVARLGTTSARG